MNIGRQIQYFRKRDNMSQEKLAEKIHVSRQSISNWENERNYP
ncbi:helix-turn-helix transcriptional regulator, partial [Bacillus cereus]